jgi:hypothetical protein
MDVGVGFSDKVVELRVTSCEGLASETTGGVRVERVRAELVRSRN